MPVTLATDGNAPLAGAAAWSESSDQHPCPPLQEAQLLGAAPSGHGRERPRRLDALRRRPLLHRLRKGGSPNRRLSPSRRVSEVCARARDATDTALERGGARGRRAGTDMHVHVHVCTACERRRGAACVLCVLHGLSMRVCARCTAYPPGERTKTGLRNARRKSKDLEEQLSSMAEAHASMCTHMHAHVHAHAWPCLRTCMCMCMCMSCEHVPFA